MVGFFRICHAGSVCIIFGMHSFSEFNTIVDIELHKWADSLQLASSCADVGMTTMFNQLHTKLISLEVNHHNCFNKPIPMGCFSNYCRKESFIFLARV